MNLSEKKHLLQSQDERGARAWASDPLMPICVLFPQVHSCFRQEEANSVQIYIDTKEKCIDEILNKQSSI